MNWRAFFDTFGFVHIPSVLSAEETTKIRKIIYTVLLRQNKEYGQILPSECVRVEEIVRIPFLEKITRALKVILDNYYLMIPDLSAARNLHGGSSSWHTDCGSELIASQNRFLSKQTFPEYLKDPRYRFVKCGVFLQDNTKEWGGGIDVIPRSHLFAVAGTPFSTLNIIARKLYTKFRIRFSPYRVPLKAGDFVAFDSRLYHRSSPVKSLHNARYADGYIANLPEERSKYTIYWDSCIPFSFSHFWRNSKKRAVRGDAFFADYVGLRMPLDYFKDVPLYSQKTGVYFVSEDEIEKYSLTADATS